MTTVEEQMTDIKRRIDMQALRDVLDIEWVSDEFKAQAKEYLTNPQASRPVKLVADAQAQPE